jgi:hypothetical protein
MLARYGHSAAAERARDAHQLLSPVARLLEGEGWAHEQLGIGFRGDRFKAGVHDLGLAWNDPIQGHDAGEEQCHLPTKDVVGWFESRRAGSRGDTQSKELIDGGDGLAVHLS